MAILFFLRMKRPLQSMVVVVGFLLAILVAGGFVSPSIHAAGGAANFSLQPSVSDPSNPATQSYFVLNLHPGTTTQLSVRVINTGTASGTVSLSPQDATTAQNGGIVFTQQGTSLKDVGSWITFQTRSLTLAAGQSKLVPFTLTVPRVVRPGQHMGGIIAKGVDVQNATSKNQHFQVNVEHIFGMAVEVNLPGSSSEQLAATGIEAGGSNNYQQLLVGLHNTGDMMLKPYGTLQVSDTNGHLLQNLPLKLGIILPQTSINYPTNVQKKALGVGQYQAVLTLNYGHNHILHYTTQFTVTQQQLQQTFTSEPLQAPAPTPFSLPLWALILIAVAGVLVVGGASGLLFWRLALRSANKEQRKGRK